VDETTRMPIPARSGMIREVVSFGSSGSPAIRIGEDFSKLMI